MEGEGRPRRAAPMAHAAAGIGEDCRDEMKAGGNSVFDKAPRG